MKHVERSYGTSNLLIDPLGRPGPDVGPGVYGSSGGFHGEPLGWAPHTAERIERIRKLICDTAGIDDEDLDIETQGEALVLIGIAPGEASRDIAVRVAASLFEERPIVDRLIVKPR